MVRLILVFLIIIAVILFFSYLGQFLTNKWKDLQAGGLFQVQKNIPQQQSAQENIPQKQSTEKQVLTRSTGSATIVRPEQSAGLIDTYITSGPEEGGVIEETNQVTFEFEAEISPEEKKNTISFETKIEGFDDKWISTSTKKRTVTLPSGPKSYTFLVRAKTKDAVDLIPAKRTFKINTSSYFGKVKISTVQIQTSSRPSLITLNTYLKNEEEINITGWNIRGKANSFTIPSGIEIYQPGYNPVPEENIFVKQGDIIYLSGGSSPFGRGRNFRPNKCLGYFTNYYDFIISLPKNCPKPTRDEISFLDPCCQEFILRLNSCQAPDYSNNIKVSLDSECVSYLDKNFNYDGCFYQHSRDDDFLGKNWYIYLNENIAVSNNCDTLYLRDENGLVVDKYSYGQPICK